VQLYLKYNKPAENSDKGWEEYSIPLGNGYMGANVFGGVECERIQITENSMVNPGMGESVPKDLGGLTNFAEMYIQFPHDEVIEYERGLCLNNAVAYTKYKIHDVEYKREYFASYPDKVLVCKLSCGKQGALSFTVAPSIPFIKNYAITEGDNGGRSGKIVVNDNVIYLTGKLDYYNILFEGQIKVITDGEFSKHSSTITVANASEAVIIMAIGTNYKLCSDVFKTTDRFKKTLGENPHKKVTEYLNNASLKTYDELYKTHLDDFSEYFNRVTLDLGECDTNKTTDELIDDYKKGYRSKYLETLYFQYGRYLLISSSRKGCLPANLQGIWNCHEHSPWGSGYWHNINVQMNYWPAFNTNLVEMFEPYADYFMAYYDAASEFAEEYIKEVNPENYRKGECGFTIGTAAYPYYITAPGVHSGPGTGALTSKLFWEYYDFTRDEDILRNVSYKALKGMSEFLTKTVKEYDGEYLTFFSASPEQMHNGEWIENGTYYHTVGCAFDQQLIYENGKDLINSAEILNINDELIKVQKEQIEKYHPIRIGWSGQIKEYIEEKFYGEIGEYNHRHISQLMALYPGTLINSNTPAWMDAAKLTLTKRTDESTGWALAHRLNAWARTGDGNHAYKILKELLANKTNPNLWDEHPPFQIDGNFGATSGIAEMLLQSHEGYIHVLPSLPDCWSCGKVSGLAARGAFVVDVEWKEHMPIKITVKSLKGNDIKIKADFSDSVKVKSCDDVEFTIDNGMLEFESGAGLVYEITGFKVKAESKKEFLDLQVSQNLEITWKGGIADIYRAIDEEACYECIAENVTSPYKDSFDFAKAETITYKVGTMVKTINHATQLQKDMYSNIVNSKKNKKTS